MTIEEITNRLRDPFPETDIEWRIGRAGQSGELLWAMALAYVTNRAIMERLDEVFGIDGWKNEFIPAPLSGLLCGISARIEGEWITKYDGAHETDIEATKGGLSGAMKRAAVQWGIGRYLYNLEATFVNCFPPNVKGNYRKDSFKKDGKPVWFKWEEPTLPEWALPSFSANEHPKADAAPSVHENENRSAFIDNKINAIHLIKKAATLDAAESNFSKQLDDYSDDEIKAIKAAFETRRKILEAK